ncbi:MAG TPA: sulfite exporter TauE/SafE family protein, partial [Solirubrobacteraceae bacterium]|nr:sulfite exporter TauE/SafE family protein [Solirubrobacteraceae bacterium]
MTIELVALSALFAAAVQATAGVGFALIVAPVLFLVMSPASAIITTTVLGILLNLLILFAEPRRPQPAWTEVLPVLAAAVPGAVCGVVLLAELPKPVLQLIVGVSVIAAALLRTRPAHRARRRGSGPRLALGATVGALSTATGINGPPLALWLSAQGLSPARVRDSLSAALLGM